jgi:hypothetical protein
VWAGHVVVDWWWGSGACRGRSLSGERDVADVDRRRHVTKRGSSSGGDGRGRLRRLTPYGYDVVHGRRRMPSSLYPGCFAGFSL